MGSWSAEAHTAKVQAVRSTGSRGDMVMGESVLTKNGCEMARRRGEGAEEQTSRKNAMFLDVDSSNFIQATLVHQGAHFISKPPQKKIAPQAGIQYTSVRITW